MSQIGRNKSNPSEFIEQKPNGEKIKHIFVAVREENEDDFKTSVISNIRN